jgi:tetratricopeptide (TPR) repeat protein
LTLALAAGEVEPTGSSVPRVRELAPATVARSVLLRLARLPPAAANLARALAVLDSDADMALAASLVSAPIGQVTTDAEALIAARILGPGAKLHFAHPILRAAVYADLAAPSRELLHRRAAEALSARDPDRAAVHLLATPPAGDAWVAEQLLAAGARSIARGATGEAVTLLDRAIAEPVPSELAARAYLARGRANWATVRAADAERDLARSFELARDQGERLDAAREAMIVRFGLGRFTEAYAAAESVLASLPDHAREERWVIEMSVGAVELSDQEVPAQLVADRLQRLNHEMPAGHPLAPIAAGLGVYPLVVRPYAQVTPLLERARRADEAIRFAAVPLWGTIVAVGLYNVGDLDAALRVIDAMMTSGRRQGDRFVILGALSSRARVRTLQGELADAEADAREALHIASIADSGFMLKYLAGILVLCLVERGSVDEAEETLAAYQLEQVVPQRVMQEWRVTYARAALRLAQNRVPEAREELGSSWMRSPDAAPASRCSARGDSRRGFSTRTARSSRHGRWRALEWRRWKMAGRRRCWVPRSPPPARPRVVSAPSSC